MGVASQRHAPAALHPANKRGRRLGGAQGRSGRMRKISPPPGIDSRTAQPIASGCTDWAHLHPISAFVTLKIGGVCFSEMLTTVRKTPGPRLEIRSAEGSTVTSDSLRFTSYEGPLGCLSARLQRTAVVFDVIWSRLNNNPCSWILQANGSTLRDSQYVTKRTVLASVNCTNRLPSGQQLFLCTRSLQCRHLAAVVH
jgi:hypothetical protein